MRGRVVGRGRADRRAQLHLLALDLVRRGERHADARDELLDLVVLVQVLAEHEELVASEARGGVGCADRRL
jgi:hypothetical protein